MNQHTGNNLLVSLRNVCVSYSLQISWFRHKKFTALHDVSFDLYQGDSLGVIGRNGAGKTTLLKTLAGIIAPDSGEINIADGCTASLLSLQVGFVPHLSGRENAILSGMLLGMQRDQVEAALPEIKSLSALEWFFEESISTYSSGMRARLGFSVAFYANPDIILLDEAMGVGDGEFRKISTELMHNKIKSDSTVVLVSHNPDTLRKLCNRAVWLENGVTRAEGSVDEIVNSYEKSFS